MADEMNRDGFRPVTYPNELPPAAAAHIAGKLLNRHSPHEIAEAVEVLIDVLDMLGGDPDMEVNGDELDGSGPEEDPVFGDGASFYDGRSPGFRLSAGMIEDDENDDPGEDNHDAEGETWSHPDDHPTEVFMTAKPQSEGGRQ